MKVRLIFLFLLNFCLSDFSAQNFIQNLGQLSDQNGLPATKVLFYGRSEKGFQIQLRKTGYSYEWIRSAKNEHLTTQKFDCAHTAMAGVSENLMNRMDLEFLNANPNCRIENLSSESYYTYYLNGAAIKANAYNKVVYHNVYDHIDVEFVATNASSQSFKYNVIVHPKADLSQFKMKLQGAQASLKNKQLVFSSAEWQVSEDIPVSFYLSTKDSLKSISFVVSNNVIGFEGTYDHQQTLVIDPISNLEWGTYHGGNNTDVCLAVGHDVNDNVYMTGYTNSASNIATNGVYQYTLAGSLDVFLSKFNKNGQRIWTSYFGGADVDIAYAMCVQPDGTCYLAGATNSTLNLASANAHQTVYGGGINDIVVASFNTNGFRNWSSYYGGSGHDIAQAIATDKSGNIVFTGHTESTANIASSGAYKTVYNFNYDVCLIKFSPTGQRLWGTYYGDSGIDEAYAIATDAQNNVYISGGSTSISDISTPSAHQLNAGGANDAFLAKFDTAGTALVWGTYLGGTGNDAGTALEIKTNTLFIGGNTSSTNNIASAGAQQLSPLSFDETFLGAFSLSGTRLWCTYFGGNDTEYINDMVIDAKSQILICGATISTINISTTGAYQTNLCTQGIYDSFLARFSSSGTKQLATYYGGEGDDQAFSITQDGMGKVYIAGQTTSTSQIASSGAFQTANLGNTDAFLAKFCIPFQAPIFPAKSATYCPGSITLSTAAGYSNYLWSNGLTINPIVVNIFALGNYKFSVKVNDGPDCVGISDTTYIKVTSCLGTDEWDANGTRLSLFPNPSERQLSIEFSDKPQGRSILTINDYQGKLIVERELSTEQIQSIDTAELLPGVYLLMVQTKDQKFVSRFVKQ